MIILRKEKQFARKIPGQSGGARGLVRKGKILLRKGKKFITTNTPGTVVATVPQLVIEKPVFTATYGATLPTPLPSYIISSVAQKLAEQSAIHNAAVKAGKELYVGTPKSIITNIGELLVKGRDKVYRVFMPNASLQQRAIQNQVKESGIRNVHQLANKVDSALPEPVRRMTLKRTAAGAVDTVLAMPA